MTSRKVYVHPGRSVHITRKDLGDRPTIYPSKDYLPEGVSLAPTIRHALEGVPFYYTRKRKDWRRRRKFVKEGNEFSVYTPVRRQVAVIPDTIDDYGRTRERRVLDKVRMRKMGRIRVRVGSNRWEYEWIE